MEILIRLGEITLKSNRSRRRFLKVLIQNMRDALSSDGIRNYEIMNLWSRVIINLPEQDNIPFSLKRVFGITSLSPVYIFSFNTYNDILDKGEDFFKEMVRGRVFAVRARRVGSHNFRSIDVARDLGSRLYPYSKGVDLKKPEVKVFVEIRDKNCFFYTDVIRCYGGLPIKSEGKVISLFSGGFDSAVASWFALKRGAEVYYLFLNLDGEEYLNKTLKVVNVLANNWSYGYSPQIYVIPGRKIVSEIYVTREDYWNVILKRILYRLGERLASEVNADSLVTGESLGQVSSQTLKNLRISQQAINIPVNRPLFGFDKEEIMKYARDIGTYNFSSVVKEYCALVPKKPILKASLKTVLEEEMKMNFNVIEEAYNNIRVFRLKELK